MSRLLVVDPSMAYPEEQGVREILDGWAGESRLLLPALRTDDRPGIEHRDWADGVVLLGSRASVHDDLPWARRLADWLRPLLEHGGRTPVLGICFGHQLLAHLAGGEIAFARPDRSKIVGVAETEFDGTRLLPGRARLRVVVSHREIVRTAPPGWRIVASRPEAEVDGMEHPDAPLFGVQFHPEARDEFAAHNGIDPAAIDDRVRRDSRRVIDGFLRLVQR